MSVQRLTPASHDDDKRNELTSSEHTISSSSESQNEAGHAGVSPATLQPRSLPSLSIPPSNDTTTESESDFPRSTSATSSLDPYYFSIPSRRESPIPPLPMNAVPKESSVFREPMTPARDPASIDRNALVGVGELLSPRWPRTFKEDGLISHAEEIEGVKDQEWTEDKDDPDNDGRGSPWTIEAIDGEPNEFERALGSSSTDMNSQKEARHFVADESGGEEIVYPRKTVRAEVSKTQTDGPQKSTDLHDQAPPSSFFSPARKAKKRSSDEFALDQSGILAPKSATGKSVSSQGREKSDYQVLRKHQSLALNSSSSSSARDRRRGGSVRLSMTAPAKSGVAASKNTKHTRQPSASSSVSAQNDFSHKFSSDDLNKAATASPQKRVSAPSTKSSSEKLLLKDKEIHASPSVAHSLLRGTQEGWSGLDDDATAEALRKLDGISGKGARARTSIGPISRLSNHSRPSTPGTNKGHRSEGNEGTDKLHRANSVGNSAVRTHEKIQSEQGKMANRDTRNLGGEQLLHVDGDKKTSKEAYNSNRAVDDLPGIPVIPDLELRKPASGARLSFTPKRGSASSTNYTGTPTSSSRDSAILSTGTSATSASVGSNRLSLIKARRNSAGSDISSIYSAEVGSQRDRVVNLTIGDSTDDASVPPVPPLPKDLSSYRTPPQSSASLVFPGSDTPETDADHVRSATDHSAPGRSQKTESRIMGSKNGSHSSASVLKTPSKKWSFTSALSIRRSASPSRHEHAAVKSTKRESRSAVKQLRPSSSKESSLLHTISPKSSVETWQRIQRGAMASESSLASLSSLSSFPEPSPPLSPSHNLRASPGHNTDIEPNTRAGTASSFNVGYTTLTDTQIHQDSSTRMPQGATNKRLTPSSIPFFRRSSSQSMQVPGSSSGLGVSTSPTFSSSPASRQGGHRSDILSPKEQLTSPTTPGHSQRKSSMLSLGLPSILKGSSSRKSIHIEKAMSGIRDSDAESKSRDSGAENLKTKKDDKDRSESRISVLMGRKRGKTLSSTDQKKVKPIALPPLQVSAIPQTTAERLAYVQSTASAVTPSRSSAATSRATSQTISSMQKQSDSSLRNSRQQLPTIAGSPSVGAHGSKDHKEQGFNHQSTSFSGPMTSLPKETPTRIPRIASRSSTVTSPVLKNSSSILASRRASLIINSSVTLEDQASDSVTEDTPNEFGVLSNIDETPKETASGTYRQQQRTSPTGGKGARQSAGFATHSTTPRKAIPESITVKGLRKSSTGSVSSMNSLGNEHHSALSALSPSKGFNKLLSPKMTLPGSRLSGSSTAPNLHQQQQSGSPTSHRQSISTPSPVPSTVDEDEVLGDEEMMQYIKRTQARKMAHGASKEELDELLKFPEPLPPGRPSSPTSILNSEKASQLSDYERKEILDYPSVYYIGHSNAKKLATRDVSSNNYGYDDDRGDYQVINHDHLAYRYEIIDTLGKGSFGQVLHCRDHCTGESVAIKIIRNKKRFHHQALVEIKILENLRKWDPEEKHYVIKMTEHFYFRNHLCIAMELLSINLYELIKANGFAGFSTTLIRRFTSQMLLSLCLMRHHRVVHCDLKPENVLLRHPAKSGIKVIDFGSSCLEHEKVYTYIQSRFYRSPEVILGMNYSMAIDMWSLGCILAELYTGYPIFPGENEQEQLSCIMEVLGVPDKDLINRSSRKRLFFDSTGAPRPVVNSKGRRRRAGTKTLAQVLRCDDELFVDFVSKCLSWDPERRIKPQSAMRHPFITAGKKSKIVNNATPSSTRHLASSSSLLSVGRSKPTETPKKSQISAPTPLTARATRITSSQIPSTPLGPLALPSQGSSKSFRSPHVSYHSSRTAGGLTMTATK